MLDNRAQPQQADHKPTYEPPRIDDVDDTVDREFAVLPGTAGSVPA